MLFDGGKECHLSGLVFRCNVIKTGTICRATTKATLKDLPIIELSGACFTGRTLLKRDEQIFGINEDANARIVPSVNMKRAGCGTGWRSQRFLHGKLLANVIYPESVRECKGAQSK